MKFFVVKVKGEKVLAYKKNKCVDGWSNNKAECWAFSNQGAKNIALELNNNNKENDIKYGFMPSYGEGRNE